MTQLRPAPIGLEALSERECAVLRAYIRHGRLRLIGNELGISEQTVKNHSSLILSKLGVATLGQAAVLFDRWMRGEAGE